jgi:phenylalanyl-tRNA synthetase alpha chain
LLKIYFFSSLEIYGYHPALKRMVEIGNSGVFRPEMLRPMGLPEDINILGWGLGLERPTMILYDIKNIRDTLGYEVKID